VVFFGAGNLDRAPGATAKIDFAVRAPTGTFADKNKNFLQDKDSEKAAATTSPPRSRKPIVVAAAGPSARPNDKKPQGKEPETKGNARVRHV